MKFSHKITATALGLSLIAGAAFADGAFDRQVKIRKAHHVMLSYGYGPLNAMAKGDMDYNEAAATVAAANLVAAASINQSGMWPEGSDNTTHETRALPAIWENFEDFQAKNQEMIDAAAAVQAVVATDLATLTPAVETLVGTCGGCHKEYRYSDK